MITKTVGPRFAWSLQDCERFALSFYAEGLSKAEMVLSLALTGRSRHGLTAARCSKAYDRLAARG